MIAALRSDQGQAFPLYVVVVAGLLFSALAFFVIGQAGVTRSDAQGAADSGALAAAGAARNDVFTGLDLTGLTPEAWESVLSGSRFGIGDACATGLRFAALNDATAQCEPDPPRFTVTVETVRTVGKSVIPGTERMHGTATATAVIEPHCHLVDVPLPSPSPSITPSPTPTPGGEGPSGPEPVRFVCKGGRTLEVDPRSPGSLNKLAKSLFTVRLVK
ncbi:hypothetical protein GCM10010347_14920 [Streptomyces cirratus]|uniref:Putative Flp pilus-assembly TadG-like N-terminal domain-containing protein n=1 Tax=Streptomyces cirratus TaxID=68187 RepID=A0ABQ3EM42_9ACTN|nr:pilus assembly protein TadG-related protein [Streptomyces cirratus]GHB46322.1 hypothetical protein GCM10010347_14920 [Streptomyces cirratus]